MAFLRRSGSAQTAPGLTEALAGLNHALAGDGQETAIACASALLPRVLSSCDALVSQAAPSLAAAFLLAGDGERGRQLLSRMPFVRGAGDERLAALSWLCDGRLPPWQHRPRLSYYLAAAHARIGALAPVELLAALARRPGQTLRRDEAVLLLHDALAPRSSRPRLLEAFLRMHGISAELTARHDGRVDLAARAIRTAPSARTVSVLVAAHNARNTVVAALESVLKQSHQELELLVCDDASDDGTLEILRASFGSDPRVRLFRSRVNQGAYNLRNALLARARGELVTFHDADDLSLPTRLARQVALLDDPGRVAVICDWLRIRPDGHVVFFADGRATRMSVVSLLVRREALLAVGPYPSARFGADLDILQRLRARHGPAALARLRTPGLLGLWSDSSVTRRAAAESLESGFRAPARRAYAEYLYQRALGRAPSQTLESLLRETDNYRSPAEIEPA
jgi:Glycosyl transferase family 2